MQHNLTYLHEQGLYQVFNHGTETMSLPKAKIKIDLTVGDSYVAEVFGTQLLSIEKR